MERIGLNRAGLAAAGVLVLWHLAWAVMVGVGAAQSVVDYVYRIHFLSEPPPLAAFSLSSAAMLVLTAALAGYAGGVVFAAIWNCLADWSPRAH